MNIKESFWEYFEYSILTFTHFMLYTFMKINCVDFETECIKIPKTSPVSGLKLYRLLWRCDDIFIEIISHTQNRVMNTIVTVRSPRAFKCQQQRGFELKGFLSINFFCNQKKISLFVSFQNWDILESLILKDFLVCDAVLYSLKLQIGVRK